MNDVGNRRPNGEWEDIPPPVGNVAVRGQPQDLEYNGMNYFDLAHNPPPALAVSSIYPCDIPFVLVTDIAQDRAAVPHEYHDHGNNNYARVAQGVPAQAEAIAPPAPVCTNGISPDIPI